MATELSPMSKSTKSKPTESKSKPSSKNAAAKPKPAWEEDDDKKKDAEEEVDESAAQEDVFDRFTEPVKKRKRKEKKVQQENEKKAKIVNDGKLFAVDLFNEPPTPEQLEMWAGYVENPVPSLPDLERLQKAASEMTPESIGYVRLAKTSGFYAVMDCLQAMGHCTEWLEARLNRVGWKRNMTGYIPTAVSHSTNEILPATLECYRMSIKQMIQFVKHHHPESVPVATPTKTTVTTTKSSA